jgi:16S rRNA C1402 (ribose-2'-O) methylase RsmI
MPPLPSGLSPTGLSGDEVLVNGFDPSIPTERRKERTKRLKTICQQQDKTGLVINTTSRSDEPFLESLGFNLVERYADAGLTTAVFDFESQSGS